MDRTSGELILLVSSTDAGCDHSSLIILQIQIMKALDETNLQDKLDLERR